MFVHLHNHTDYSLLDGACRIPHLVETAAHQGAPAVGITDHGNMFGVLDFYTKARDAGLKPVIGCELYLAPGSRFEKKPGKAGEMRYHQVLFAKSLAGYKNLYRLCSEGYISGFYYKPRIDKQLLAQYAQDLICLSSCQQGEIPQLILNRDLDGARQAALFYKNLFSDDFYIELMRHNLKEDEILIPHLAQLAQDLNIKTVVTNDAHYLKREHSKAHDILLCVGTQAKVDDVNRMRFDSDEFYLKTPGEMRALFYDFPQALATTLEIADKCNVEIPLGMRHFPIFTIPSEACCRPAAVGSDDTNMHSITDHAESTAEEKEFDVDQYLDRLTRIGFSRRYGENPSQEARERLESELKVIKQTGFANYFLIVWDFVRWAKEHNIPVGPGRGSAAGSIVSYCLGITNLDPLRWGLIFERFLNPERVSPPDIDIDFADDRRAEVINYVREKYGSDAVCRITTFGKMAARSAVRDVARALNMSYAEGDRIAKLIPEYKDFTLDKAESEVPEIAELVKSDPRYKTLLDHAKIIEGAVRHSSVHAAGVVICPGPVLDYIPVYKNTDDPDLFTQYDMNWMEGLGLLKMDFLGLQTLQEIDITIKTLAKRGINLDLDNLTFDDPAVFQLFGEGKTTSVFQFESSGMRDNLMRLKPERLEDLIAMNALFRPGPMQMIDDFIARRHGRKAVTYLHPRLEPILKETYGVIVYQEQVIRIATDLAGYSLGKADLYRKAMGKKIPELMAAQQPEFVAGCLKNKIDQKTVGEIFAACEHFAGYGFVKAHSAGYAVIAYQCAYLKAHYSAEYLAACLTVRRNESGQVMRLMAECRAMSIRILPPDINLSEAAFTAENSGIRFGLAAIRNIGDAAVHAILHSRQAVVEFTSLFNFLTSVDLRTINKRVIESLIDAGAFDCFGETRATLAASLPGAMAFAQASQEERERGQNGLFSSGAADSEASLPLPQLHRINEWRTADLLSREKTVLGYYISCHPLDRYVQALDGLVKRHLSDKDSFEDGQHIRLYGVITNVQKKATKSGERWATVHIEDLTGTIECLAFPTVYEKYIDMLQTDRIIALMGRISRQDSNEDPKIRLEEIFDIDQAVERWGQSVDLKLSAEQITEPLMLRLEKLFTDYPGHNPVYFDIALPSGKSKRLKIGKYKIQLSRETIGRLSEWMGADRIAIGS